MLGRQSRWRSPCHDHVKLQPNQLACEIGEPFSPAVGRAVLDHQVLPLDVPEFSEPLSECCEVGGVRRYRHDLQHTDAVDLPRRLRLSDERCERQSDSEKDREPDQPNGHLSGGRLPGSLANAPHADRDPAEATNAR
jgi:hypothetical protein